MDEMLSGGFALPTGGYYPEALEDGLPPLVIPPTEMQAVSGKLDAIFSLLRDTLAAPDLWHPDTLNGARELKLYRDGRKYLAVLATADVPGCVITALGVQFTMSLRPGWNILPFPDGSGIIGPSGMTPQQVMFLRTNNLEGIALETLQPPAYLLYAGTSTISVTTTIFTFDARNYKYIDILVSGVSFVGGTSPQITVNVNAIDDNQGSHNLWTTNIGGGGVDQRAIGYNAQQNVLLGKTIQVQVALIGAPTSATFYIEVFGRYV